MCIWVVISKAYTFLRRVQIRAREEKREKPVSLLELYVYCIVLCCVVYVSYLFQWLFVCFICVVFFTFIYLFVCCLFKYLRLCSRVWNSFSRIYAKENDQYIDWFILYEWHSLVDIFASFSPELTAIIQIPAIFSRYRQWVQRIYLACTLKSIIMESI